MNIFHGWYIHVPRVYRVREKLPKNNMGSGVPGGVPLLLLCQDGSRCGAYRNNATKKISTSLSQILWFWWFIWEGSSGAATSVCRVAVCPVFVRKAQGYPVPRKWIRMDGVELILECVSFENSLISGCISAGNLLYT